MKKLLVLMMLSISFLFASINLQTATKAELMTIKGIGPVKADQIIEYRKKNKLSSADDLKNIKGFGDSVVNNVKENKTITKEDGVKKIKETKIEKKEETLKKIKETKAIKK